MSDRLKSVVDGIAAFARGEMVIVSDDDDRENEGDLFLAASMCTPQQMAFIIRHTSGIVCTPLSSGEARRLNLLPMVALNDAPLATAFTVSVDAREGVTTGISADDRTTTVRALANNNNGAADFVKPGHIFPLIAKDGGVLMRSGHTEACVDMCRLAGLPEVGVLAELMNDDGSVMCGPQVRAFAVQHNLKQISVTDIIAFRQAREKLVKRVGEFPVASSIGMLQGYAYVTPFDPQYHMAFVYGDVGDGLNMPARLHRADLINEVFGGAKLINSVLVKFNAQKKGVIVYLRDGTAGVPVTPIPGDVTPTEAARTKQWREIGLGAQILKDLGISSIHLISSAKTTYVGLAGFGIEIVKIEKVES